MCGNQGSFVAKADQQRYCLTDAEVLTLARWAVAIETHYLHAHGGTYTPVDVEFAKDGPSGKLYVVQARPETVHSQAVRASTHASGAVNLFNPWIPILEPHGD